MRVEEGRRRHVGRAVRAVAGVAAVAAIATVPTALPAPAVRAADRPNVIVIMTDDQTVESVRVMANVERLLAADGATFENSFASFPLCCPSRATFLTGQYSHNTGVVGNDYGNGISQFKDKNALPVWLSRAGYTTMMVGKYLNEYGRFSRTYIPPGWKEWYAGIILAYFGHSMNQNGRFVGYASVPWAYQSDVYTEIAVDLIHKYAPSPKPFFLWLSYFAPHRGGPREPGDPVNVNTPVPAPRHKGLFRGERLPSTPAFDEADVSDKPAFVRSRPPLTAAQKAGLQAAYEQRLESLLAVDEGVGAVIAALRETNSLKNTLIIFTSDNGYLLGEHRILDGKEHVYEPSVRVPLIMRGPGIPAGLRLQQPVVNADLAPTILEATGAKPGLTVDGRSLVPLFADPGLEWGRDILLERGPGATTSGPRIYTAIHTPRFVYVEYSNGERELYDLALDPDQLESKHLDPAYDGIRQELARRLAELRDCAGATCRLAPALRLDTTGDADCVRSALVTGTDEKLVEFVEFLADGRVIGRDASAPFEQPTLPPTATRLRALAGLVDGRRFTLDRTIRVCV